MGKKVIFLYGMLIFIAFPTYIAGQQTVFHNPVVRTAVYFDVSPPLRDMPAIPPTKADQSWKEGVIKNFFDIKKNLLKKTDNTNFIDPVRQNYYGLLSTDTTVENFGGTGNVNGAVPPDTDGDVGLEYYFQVVNLSFAIYNKSGYKLLGPLNNSTIWAGIPDNSNSGDPVVIYDEQANRWLFSQLSLPYGSYAPFYEMIAVSQTPDPTGSWYRWQFEFDELPDYPKFGVWPDGYYMSFNRFTAGSENWDGIGAISFDRTAMLAGNPNAQMILFTLPSSNEAYSMLPSDCDGSFPSAGTPNYFTYIYTSSPYHMGIYEFHTDWTTPSISTFGNFLNLPVTSFNSSLPVLNGGSIPQSGTTTQLDAITDRLMYRLQYRQFNDHQSIVCNHTVNAGSDVAGIRWYELRKTTGAWSVYQQSTYSPDSRSRWMGSIAMDSSNNIALGYSVSSSSMYPSVKYTGRMKNDALGQMTINEKGIMNGSGSQTGIWSSRSRWGDYSSMVVDPSAPSTFWYTQEYYQATSSGTWSTRIASFHLGTVPLTADFTADNTTPAINTTVSFTDLSSGIPTTWNWSFSPSTVTFVNSSNSSPNPKVQFNANNSYTVTLLVSNGSGSNTKIKTGYIHAGIAGLWSGITSTDWNTASNWNNYLVPTSATNVSIPSPGPNYWPSFTGDLTLGTQCNNITLSGNALLTVTGNLTINPGYSLIFTGSGNMFVGGNWTNSGIFTTGTGTIGFTGTGPGKIIGGITSMNYVRSTFPTGMTAISGGSPGPTGDDNHSDVPLGFTFNYLGVNYTQIRITCNGWASLNLTGADVMSYDNTALFSTSLPNTTLTPWWDDLIADGTTSISYITTGTAPNRVFTVEWKHILSFYTGATTRLNLQVKLYESTNVIEFCYGNVESGTHNSSESASIGIEDATGGSGHFIEATTGSMITGISTLVSNVNWPGVNYRFTPPLVTITFYNLKESKTNATFSIDNNITVTVNGNLILSQ